MKKKPEEKKPAVPVVMEPQPERSAKAVVKHLRIGPRKVRLVINSVRHKNTNEAFRTLMTLKQKAARFTEKLLKSAIANARVLGLDENRLYFAEVRADGGPMMKRFMERSMGRADRIVKRTTHMTLIVKEGKKTFSVGETTVAAKERKSKEKKAAAKA